MTLDGRGLSVDRYHLARKILRLRQDTSLDCCQTSSFAGAGAGIFDAGISGVGVGSDVGSGAGRGAGSVIGRSGIAGDDTFRS